MNSGLSNLNDRSILGDSEVKILETQDSMASPKTKVVPKGVIPGTQSVIDISTSSVGQIPPPVIKSTVAPAPANGSGPVLSSIAAKVDLDKFMPGLATQLDVDSLAKKALQCDFVATEAGYAAVEFADCNANRLSIFWLLQGSSGRSVYESSSTAADVRSTVNVRDNLPGGGRIIHFFFQG